MKFCHFCEENLGGWEFPTYQGEEFHPCCFMFHMYGIKLPENFGRNKNIAPGKPYWYYSEHLLLAWTVDKVLVLTPYSSLKIFLREDWEKYSETKKEEETDD